MSHHPTPTELEELVLGRLPAEQTRSVVGHLLRGCSSCGLHLAPYLPGLSSEGKRFEAVPASALEIYDGALDRAFASVRQLEEDGQSPKSLERRKQAALALLSSGKLESLDRVPPEIQGLPLYEALLERSWTLRHEDPEQMVQFAHFAALLAERMSERQFGAQHLISLRCRAWVELANAYRVADELDHAEMALGRATEQLLLESCDEILGARFLDVLASLFAARRKFEMALATLDIVKDIYGRHGDTHLAGRALVSKGIYTGYQGDSEEAVRLIQEGLSLIDDQREPRVVFSAVQSQAWLLADCGRFKEARLALWELRRRNVVANGRVDELKVRWLEGHIFVGLDQLDRAEQALRQVKQGFEEAGLRYKAALAGLELGAVWFRQGRLEATASVVLESIDVFLSLGIHREVLASMLVLRKAVETEYLTLGVLTHVIEALRRTEQDSKARFEPATEP